MSRRLVLVDLFNRRTIVSQLETHLGHDWEFLRVDGRGARLRDAIPRRTSADGILLVAPRSAAEDLDAAIELLQIALPSVPIVVVADWKRPSTLRSLLRPGIADLLTPPFDEPEVAVRVGRILNKESHLSPANSRPLPAPVAQLIGESPAFLESISGLRRMARRDSTVLIQGETGTGKEICARAIHDLGSRTGEFVPVNCGAIPSDLIENELFGHDAAAYTGASNGKAGLIERAEGGTLFLDEIDSLSPLAQVKLLRILQEREFRRLGSTQTRVADVRFIAATNADLRAAVDRGQVRQDLFYRLNVLAIELPRLADREEDAVLLARHFIGGFAGARGRPEPLLSYGAAQALLQYDWPGNVRELEHVIERAMILCDDRPVISRAEIRIPQTWGSEVETFKMAKERAVARFEIAYIERALRRFDGNISRAADSAGKNRRAFWELMRKHAIDADRFRQPSH